MSCILILHYQLSHKGSSRILQWVARPFSSRSSQPRSKPGSPALQADSLTTELLGKPLFILLQFSSVAQSCPTLRNPMDCRTGLLSITNSWSLLKLMSIESVMPSNHLILCLPLLLPHSINFQHSCLENSLDRGAWQATVHEATKSQTWLSD